MINPTKEMIVLKGEIKTSSVQSCLYNRGTQKWDVVFTNGRVFSYAYDNVEKIYPGLPIDLSEYNLQGIGGQSLGDVKEVYGFRGHRMYYHVVFETGNSRDYSDRDVRLLKSVFSSEKSKDIWDYFKRISEINKLPNDSDKSILRKQYDLFIIDCMLQKNNLDTLIDYDGKEMSPLS